MSYTITVRPRAERLTAMQLEEGRTTASAIEEFCGQDKSRVGRLESDPTDLRWIHVKTTTGWTDQVGYGFWIVKDECGNLEVLGGVTFLDLYAPATDTDRDTLRSRDVNDSRVQEANALATAFARSLATESAGS
jgi:hypothetical protein